MLVWHAQSPEWFFKEDYSKEESAAYVSEEVMYARMEMYIRSVIHHVYTVDGGAYKDVVYAWDVANEYFSNTPDENWSAVFGNRSKDIIWFHIVFKSYTGVMVFYILHCLRIP